MQDRDLPWSPLSYFGEGRARRPHAADTRLTQGFHPQSPQLSSPLVLTSHPPPPPRAAPPPPSPAPPPKTCHPEGVARGPKAEQKEPGREAGQPTPTSSATARGGCGPAPHRVLLVALRAVICGAPTGQTGRGHLDTRLCPEVLHSGQHETPSPCPLLSGGPSACCTGLRLGLGVLDGGGRRHLEPGPAPHALTTQRPQAARASPAVYAL